MIKNLFLNFFNVFLKLLYLISNNTKLYYMKDLTENIGKICNILEDAVELQDWKLVEKMIKELDDIYNQLERADLGFDLDNDY